MIPERREFPRLRAPVLIEFDHPTTAQREHSFTQDVSESGLRFPTAAELRIGQELTLDLLVPEQPAIRASGQVVWIRQIADIGQTQYDVGMRFRWSEQATRERLGRFVQNLMSRRM